LLERDRSHWGINIIENITEELEVGFELGNYEIQDQEIDDINSNYFQFSEQLNF